MKLTLFSFQFLRARTSITIARINYTVDLILSLRLSVRLSCLSRPGTDQSPGEIETSGFRRMIA